MKRSFSVPENPSTASPDDDTDVPTALRGRHHLPSKRLRLVPQPRTARIRPHLACQRRNDGRTQDPNADNLNPHLTAPLEALGSLAKSNGGPNNVFRARTYERAATVLRKLPYRVTTAFVFEFVLWFCHSIEWIDDRYDSVRMDGWMDG